MDSQTLHHLQLLQLLAMVHSCLVLRLLLRIRLACVVQPGNHHHDNSALVLGRLHQAPPALEVPHPIICYHHHITRRRITRSNSSRLCSSSKSSSTHQDLRRLLRLEVPVRCPRAHLASARLSRPSCWTLVAG